jgi:guanylate kinase
VLERSPVRLVKSVSATTRAPRKGEVDGVDYYFLTREEFERRLAADEFLEWAEVFKSGNLYGTLRSELKRAGDQGAWAFLEIDVQGALEVMKQYPEAVTIFLTTPSEEVYESRLRNRGTESDAVIERRLATAREELKSAGKYRYQVVNDDLDRAVAEISDILVSQETGLHAR